MRFEGGAALWFLGGVIVGIGRCCGCGFYIPLVWLAGVWQITLGSRTREWIDSIRGFDGPL